MSERVATESYTEFLPDERATEHLAERLASGLPTRPSGWTILLQGELGAGKSTFARALLRALGHAGSVPSPTYTLVEPYELQGFTAYHIDLYRISSGNELEYLGWSDLRDGMLLVEWPERAPELDATADIGLKLDYDGDARRATLQGLSDRGSGLIAALAQQLA